jgi:hypothetical protein
MGRLSASQAAPPAYNSDQEKAANTKGTSFLAGNISDDNDFEKRDHTHRKLKSRHIQLIGIGGTIGTALYVRNQNGPRRVACRVNAMMCERPIPSHHLSFLDVKCS